MHDRLTTRPFPADLRGLVVLLHGGAERGERPVDHRSLALRRTRWMWQGLAPALHEAGIGSTLLRFSVKGWNAAPGEIPSPVRDARLAVRDLHEAHPEAPIVLLGHSMGARTAAQVADEEGVHGVVGLAPWFPADDPVDALVGKQLVAVHGSRDRITSPKASRIFVERAARVAAGARHVELPGLGHYMLRGVRRWNQVALTETLDVLGVTSRT